MNVSKLSIYKCFLILLLFLFFVAMGRTTAPVQAQEGVNPSNQACSGLDVVLIIDQSGSMRINDPDGFRIESARQALHQMGDNALYLCPQMIHRIGMVSFGNSAQIDLPFTEIDPDLENLETWQGIREQLNSQITPEDLVETDFAEAFAQAKQMFDSLGPLGEGTRKRAIILLTDGGPCVPEQGCVDGNYTFDDDLYLKALGEQIQRDFPFQSDAEGYHLWVVAMRNQINENDGSTNYLDRYLRTIGKTIGQYWEELAQNRGGELIELSRNRNEIPPTFSEIITQLGGSGGSKRLECGIHYLESYTERVTITFFKDNPNIAAKIEHILNDGGRVTLENGQATQPEIVQITEYSGKESLTERYVIYRPPAGAWNITTTNCEAVEIRQKTIMPLINQVEPTKPLLLYDIAPFYDPNSPHKLEYQIREKGSGQLFSENTQYPLKIEVTITSPSAEIVKQTLIKSNEATFTTPDPILVNELGTYQVRLVADTDSADPRSTERFEVFSDQQTNYTVRTDVMSFGFEIVSPQPDSNQPPNTIESDEILPLVVTLNLVDEAGQPLDPARVFTSPPDSWFEVIVTHQNGTSFTGSVMREGVDSMNLIAHFDTATIEGAYTLDVVLTGTHREDRFLPSRQRHSIPFNRYTTTQFDMEFLEPQANSVQPNKRVEGGTLQAQPIPVKVGLSDHNSGAPIDPATVLADPSQADINAILYGPQGAEIDRIDLQFQANPPPGHFVGEFLNHDTTDEHQIQIELLGQLADTRYQLVESTINVPFTRVPTEAFDFQILEPSTAAELPLHQSGSGCVLGSQVLPSVGIQLTDSGTNPLGKEKLNEVLAHSAPTAKFIAPDGTQEDVTLQLIDHAAGARLVGQPESLPALAGEYKFEASFVSGSSSPFLPLYESREVVFSRQDSLLTTPWVCRGASGLIGTIIMGLLLIAGWLMVGGPVGTLALVDPDHPEHPIAGPWTLRPFPRYQKKRGPQLEALGIKEIRLSKGEQHTPEDPRSIKVDATDINGEIFMMDLILYAGDPAQPFADDADIVYE